jgi:hypothetical protein
MSKPKLVPNETYPGMYHVKFSDGKLSDMVNMARAKQLLATERERQEAANA